MELQQSLQHIDLAAENPQFLLDPALTPSSSRRVLSFEIFCTVIGIEFGQSVASFRWVLLDLFGPKFRELPF